MTPTTTRVAKAGERSGLFELMSRPHEQSSPVPMAAWLDSLATTHRPEYSTFESTGQSFRIGPAILSGTHRRMNGKREPPQDVDDLARAVIGAAIEVHRELGPGFPEIVYEAALAVELDVRHVPFVRQYAMKVAYKGIVVGEGRADFLVRERLIVEIKAVSALAPVHEAQVVAYLKATGISLGLLLNFNCAVLKDGIKRLVLT